VQPLKRVHLVASGVFDDQYSLSLAQRDNDLIGQPADRRLVRRAVADNEGPAIVRQSLDHPLQRRAETQRPALAVSGWFGVLVLALSAWGTWFAAKDDLDLLWVPIVVFALVATSLVTIPPGQTSVIKFFGTYVGSVRRTGFWWVLPLTIHRRVSVRGCETLKEVTPEPAR
jgi:hypothetical protein